jgi:hypothetical protein
LEHGATDRSSELIFFWAQIYSSRRNASRCGKKQTYLVGSGKEGKDAEETEDIITSKPKSCALA